MRFEPNSVIVADGLRDGEIVVTAGVHVLRPGQKVKLVGGSVMSILTANLSEWAINNRALVTFLMIVTIVAGVWSYLHLGRSEDPPFTFKAMIVQAQWPGAIDGRHASSS